MEPPSPGWYRDPKRPGGRRYWDGHAWVDVDGVSDAPPDPSPVASAPRLIAQRRGGEQEEAPVDVPVEATDEISAEQDAETQSD